MTTIESIILLLSSCVTLSIGLYALYQFKTTEKKWDGRLSFLDHIEVESNNIEEYIRTGVNEAVKTYNFIMMADDSHQSRIANLAAQQVDGAIQSIVAEENPLAASIMNRIFAFVDEWIGGDADRDHAIMNDLLLRFLKNPKGMIDMAKMFTGGGGALSLPQSRTTQEPW